MCFHNKHLPAYLQLKLFSFFHKTHAIVLLICHLTVELPSLLPVSYLLVFKLFWVWWKTKQPALEIYYDNQLLWTYHSVWTDCMWSSSGITLLVASDRCQNILWKRHAKFCFGLVNEENINISCFENSVAENNDQNLLWDANAKQNTSTWSIYSVEMKQVAYR